MHKISAEDKEKMREKGISSMLKAEMNEQVYKKGGGKLLWAKVAGTSLGEAGGFDVARSRGWG